jgi:hypothetical protein
VLVSQPRGGGEVPEPGTLLLLGAGVTAFIRKRASKA